MYNTRRACGASDSMIYISLVHSAKCGTLKPSMFVLITPV